ncbi:hypothetical protein DL546_001800 [Coniochaeta pulveracea]|uniref:Uncharacterized protein n=1 Tax=Coniochaeta pulveracea TaxID=177199 RepID=A0A420YKR6_9PEZI|nr:hypothetical protein DL546_001800 [Coniochaeta pulveracea]
MASMSFFTLSSISTGIAAFLVMIAMLLMVPATRSSTISVLAQINRTVALACGRLVVAFLWPFIAILNLVLPVEEPHRRPRNQKYSRQGSRTVPRMSGTRPSTPHPGRRVRFRLVREKSYPPVFSDTEED